MESNSILRIIRYNWAVIVLFALAGLLVGGLFANTRQPEYTASAEVFVTVTGGTSTGELAQGSNFSQQQARNFSAVATREVVLGPVIADLGLDDTVEDLRLRVTASVPLNTSLITISATDASADRAADIANSVAMNLAEVVPTLSPRVDGDSPVRLQAVEAAVPPESPSSPNVPLLLFLGLILGVLASVVFIVIREFVGAKVRSKEQVTEIAGANVVGSIAFDRRAAKNPMALASDTRSLRAEEYRQLRANLRFLQTGESHKAFVVTSSIPGEGKSSTSANMAAALAASGLAVCLVEADLRRPSLARALDLPEGIGLTSVLTGDATVEDSLLEWGSDGLKVLLAGDVPPNPSELLESSTTAATLQRIRSQFDVTVIDCPPLNPVADAAVIARLFGTVILVVGLKRVRVRELRRAVDRLATVGATIEGTVVNLATTPVTSRYRYGSYETPTDAEPRVAAEATDEAPAGEVALRRPESTVRPEEVDVFDLEEAEGLEADEMRGSSSEDAGDDDDLDDATTAMEHDEEELDSAGRPTGRPIRPTIKRSPKFAPKGAAAAAEEARATEGVVHE